MKHNFRLVEKEGKYFIYQDEQEYLTPLHLPLATSDKGLAETIIRKISEGKPNLVKLYLSRYDKEKLSLIITEIASTDSFFCYNDISTYLNLESTFCKEIHLRKLIDAYTECGSVLLPFRIGTFDVYDEELNDDYDPFMAGMAATSGLYMDEVTDFADMIYEEMADFMEDDIIEQIPEECITEIVSKYNAFILPSAPRTRKRFLDMLEGL